MKIIYAFLIFLNIVYSKVISIKSGGLKGFYMFGISKYIKENYNLNNFHFYGAIAGSWNSLYLSQKNIDNLLSFHYQFRSDSQPYLLEAQR